MNYFPTQHKLRTAQRLAQSACTHTNTHTVVIVFFTWCICNSLFHHRGKPIYQNI